MSWGDSPADFVGEPRKVFINYLIWQLKQIEWRIYYERRSSLAIRPMRGLIASLSKESKKSLEGEYKQLQSFEANVNLASREVVEQIFWSVNNFLQDTYLKETRFAKPIRPSKDKMGVPKW